MIYQAITHYQHSKQFTLLETSKLLTFWQPPLIQSHRSIEPIWRIMRLIQTWCSRYPIINAVEKAPNQACIILTNLFRPFSYLALWSKAASKCIFASIFTSTFLLFLSFFFSLFDTTNQCRWIDFGQRLGWYFNVWLTTKQMEWLLAIN